MKEFAALVCLGSIVALSGGCSSGSNDDGRVKVYPVSGMVKVDGQPAAGARVVFYGATPELTGPGTVSPAAETDESGVFHLRSYEPEDGAPAGKFNVTVSWPEEVPEGVDPEVHRPKDRLKNRYLNPETSGLTADVPEGGIELPSFELK
jgi:hypothetical protein